MNQFVVSKKRINYNCFSYKTKYADSRKCTSHVIEGTVLRRTVLAAINNLIAKAYDTETFYEYVNEIPDQMAEVRKALGKMQKRNSELDALLQRLYEKNSAGVIDDDAFAKLFATYRDEQKALAKNITEMKAGINRSEVNQENLLRFAGIVQSYTEPQKELTRELLTTLIEKIVVHAPEGAKYERNKPQRLDIIWRLRG